MQSYFPVHQPVVTNSMHFQSTYTSHLQYLQSEAHLESIRTSPMELFCENRQRVKAVGCFRRRAPSCMFDRMFNWTLIATLPNNLLQLEEALRRSSPPLELYKGILDSPVS